MMRHLFANSSTLRARMGADNVTEALTRIKFEQPFQAEEIRPTTMVLPEVQILRPTQSVRVFSGGLQPQTWPEADYFVYVPFWPLDDYHRGENENIADEWLEAIDFAAKVFQEVRSNNGLLDITISGTAYGAPALSAESRMDVYNSLTEDVGRDFSTGTADYDYFYFAYYQLRVQP
jgi:hypothetical protein